MEMVRGGEDEVVLSLAGIIWHVLVACMEAG